MNEKRKRGSMRVRPLDLLLLAGAVLGVVYAATARRSADPTGSTFDRSVDMGHWRHVAVQADGRLRSFESHAKLFMGYISGPREIDGRSHAFRYLDLLFRPESYQDRAIVFVKNKLVREQFIRELKGRNRLSATQAAQAATSGLFSPEQLALPEITQLMERLSQDLIRTAKPVNTVASALMALEQGQLFDWLRMIPPLPGRSEAPWSAIGDLVKSGAPVDEVHATARGKNSLVGWPVDFEKQFREAWNKLGAAWRQEDVAAVHDAMTKIADLVSTIAPETYPSQRRLSLESWYFRNHSMTWLWWFYALACIPLLLSVIHGWTWARRTGMALFLMAFTGHTASLIVRWIISSRWPNSNMFEAVHTSAWMGGVAAIILEWIVRRKPVRNVFALSSAAVSMAALMAAYFLPAYLDSTINNKMAALHDVWLYIHTNMIILSYALIGLSCVTSLLYLRHRWCLAWDDRRIGTTRLIVIPIAVFAVNGAAYLLLMHFVDPIHRGLSPAKFAASLSTLLSSAILLGIELWDRRSRLRALGLTELSAVGGAASLLRPSTTGNFIRADSPSAGQVLDGATMVVLELSFLTLWTGIVMGAIWADHSWGRPWGWDPKEVFALNTLIIFLILLHVRWRVKDKAFWTAILAVAGFQVMMFNWIVVNFIITGLHSYA